MRDRKKLVAMVLTGVLAFGTGIVPQPSAKAVIETVQAATINEDSLTLQVGDSQKLKIHVMHEDIFNSMHRI